MPENDAPEQVVPYEGDTTNFQTDEAEWEVIVRFNGSLESIKTELGAEVELLFQNYAILTLPRDKIPALYAYPQIVHIELPKMLSYMASFNLISTCVRPVQDPNLFNLTGKKVIVAIIDSGIDYTHQDFRRADGGSRILFLWDQTGVGRAPSGFSDGVEYTNEQLNQALASPEPEKVVPERDDVGHGTAVAGIAAGNGTDNKGVAPEADLIVVKVGMKGYRSFARTTELMRAVKYVIEKAMLQGKPVAVNLSFGTNLGSHLGDSLFETYLAEISSLWKTVIVVPTGNEGSAGHHYAGQINTGQTLEVDFFTASGIGSFYITLWKQFEDSFSVEVIFPSGKSSGILGIENQTKVVREGENVLTMIYGQPSRYSFRQEIFFHVRAAGNYLESGLWKIRVIAGRITDGAFNMWLPTVEEVTEKTFFSEASEKNTLTLPSTAARVIRVAGYNDRLGNIAEFSGRGNENLALPNPDLAAPAVGILSAKAGGGYDAFTGTSIAAPFVTGAAALMMQWGIVNGKDPFLYGERVRAFLRLGADRREYVRYPNQTFGYGTLCLNSTIKYLEDYQQGKGELWGLMM